MEKIINGIVAAINAVNVFGEDMEEVDLGCLEGFEFGADDDAVNATLKRRSMNDLPGIVAEMGWHGASFCDNVVNAYAEDKWHALRPLEQESLLECVKLRYLGAQIAEQTGILSLQTITYDWVERGHAVMRLLRTVFAYLEGLTPRQTREFLTDIEYKEYLPAVRRWFLQLTTTFTPENSAQILASVASEIATAVQKSGPSGNRVVRLVTGASNVTRRVAKYWSDRNVTQRAVQTFDRIGSITPDSFSDSDAETHDAAKSQSVFAHPVLHNARRRVRVVVDAGAKAARDANTYLLGAAGVSSDVNPCNSEFSVVCLNCNLLDNIGKATFVRCPLFFLSVLLTFPSSAIRLFSQSKPPSRRRCAACCFSGTCTLR